MPCLHSIWPILAILACPAVVPPGDAAALAGAGRQAFSVIPGRGAQAAALADVSPAAAAAPLAAAQVQQPASAPQDSTGYTIFLNGRPVGREDVTVQTDASGTTVTSQGRLSAPFNSVISRAEFRYGPDWTAESFSLEGTIGGGPVTIETTFESGTAATRGKQGPEEISVSHEVAPRTVILPNGVFSGYAALSLRLASVEAGAELRAYVLPNVELGMRVAGVHAEQVQLGADIMNVRRYDLIVANPDGDLAASLTAAEDGSLLRLHVGAHGVDVVRDDVAASTARTRVYSNPGDEPVTIPVSGFNLGGTLSRPSSGPARLPAVILVSGPTIGDREGFGYGIPVLGQLAGALADAGFLVVRYDARGQGQSGGRAESATLQDYAEDVRRIFRWLEDRDDVDDDRIAVLGHGEAAWIALRAAAREGDIAAAVSIAAPAVTGAEWNLEQQRLALERSTLTDAERETRVALQKQIQTAVLTGEGWEGVPVELRQAADTPWFESLLRFDPADVIEDVDQPLLFIHGESDRQVPVSHVERLSQLAREESDSKAIEVVVVRGVNHVLVPTDDVSESASAGLVADGVISTEATEAIARWLTATFAAIR